MFAHWVGVTTATTVCLRHILLSHTYLGSLSLSDPFDDNLSAYPTTAIRGRVVRSVQLIIPIYFLVVRDAYPSMRALLPAPSPEYGMPG